MNEWKNKQSNINPLIIPGLIALGWHIEYGEAGGERNAMQQGSQGDSKNPHNYNPSPADMTNLTLSKEMMNVAERLSEDAHDIQVRYFFLFNYFYVWLLDGCSILLKESQVYVIWLIQWN